MLPQPASQKRKPEMKKLSEVFSEQHREKGRFKPTVPRNVLSRVVATPKLDERCWTGYRQIGMKKKGDRMVPNCVQDSVEIPQDAPSIQSIAKKHGVSEEQIQKQLEMGLKVEKEHTSDIQAATEIALDHLNEKPDYYTRLKTIGEANAAAIAAATAIAKKKSGNYDKEGMRKTPYKNPDAPNVKSNAQRRKEMNEDFAGDRPQQVAGSAQATLTDKPNKEPMKTYKQLKNITELSTELLHRYKEKAAADASKADKAGNFERGNKRFSGVVKATNKQFANFKKKGFSEAKDDKREYDYEGEMVKSDLRSIIANANRLIDMLDDDDNLPEWCQNKVTLAEDYISTVANYMTAEMNEEVEQIDEGLEKAKTFKKNGDMLNYHKHMEKHYGNLAAKAFIKNNHKENSEFYKHNSMAVKHNDAYLNLKNKIKEEVEQLDEKNVPTNPGLWSRAKALARSKFDVYPSAYANGWASKWYKSKGGGWKSVSEEVEQIDEISAKTAMSYLHKTYDTKGYKDHSPQTQKGIQRATRKVSQDAMQKDYEKSYKAGLSTEETKPPFEGGTKPKDKVIAGKHGKAYSTARHLARMAMQKQVEKMKKAPIKEESKKAAIVKDVMKKKKTASEDAFQKDPELSTTLTKL